MGKSSRFKFKYADNASKFHKNMGDLLRNSIFKNYKIYQEYPVNKINPKHPSGRHHFDWYIKDLNLVIEVHGQQHYEPVCFGGISEAEADRNLSRQKVKDAMKEDAALNAGATYIVIRYDEEINEEMLLQKILDANAALKDKLPVELIESEPTETEEEILTKAEHEKEKKRKRMEEKEKASERRKLVREKIKESKQHKENLEKARVYRKAKYNEYKEKLAAQKKKAK